MSSSSSVIVSIASVSSFCFFESDDRGVAVAEVRNVSALRFNEEGEVMAVSGTSQSDLIFISVGDKSGTGRSSSGKEESTSIATVSLEVETTLAVVNCFCNC